MSEFQGAAMTDNPIDEDLIAQYRERFRCGPVGLWTTSLGAGWDICFGSQFRFNPDFTGLACMYDSGDEETPEVRTPFTWRLVSDFTIETKPVGTPVCDDDWGILRYDFQLATSKYGGDRMLVLCEVGDESVGGGFWWSSVPLILAGE